MAPVFGWMTTTEQFFALVLATSALQACSASYCSAGLIVSLMDSPSLAGVSSWVPARGIGCWLRLVSTSSVPVVPVSSASYSFSMPS